MNHRVPTHRAVSRLHPDARSAVEPFGRSRGSVSAACCVHEAGRLGRLGAACRPAGSQTRDALPQPSAASWQIIPPCAATTIHCRAAGEDERCHRCRLPIRSGHRNSISCVDALVSRLRLWRERLEPIADTFCPRAVRRSTSHSVASGSAATRTVRGCRKRRRTDTRAGKAGTLQS